MSVAHGGLMGWFSPALLILKTKDSPVGQLSVQDASWLGSCSYIGGFFGTFAFMLFIKLFGRKISFCIMAIPNLVNYLITKKLTKLVH